VLRSGVKTVTLTVLMASLGACAGPSTSPTPADPDRQSLRGVERAEASVGQPKKGAQNASNLPPPALVQGTPVTNTDLTARLEEAGGSIVLEEIALDRLLDKAIAESQIPVPQRDVEAEQELFVQTLAEEAKLTPDQALLMMNDLRKSRGLGPVRFADLLARNAKLRALVRPTVEVSPEEVAQSLAAEFGPRARLRVITVPTQARAMEIKHSIVDGLNPVAIPPAPDTGPPAAADAPRDPMSRPTRFSPDDRATVTLRFSQAALESSTDSTAPRGGLVASISPADQGLAPPVRKELEHMLPGDISGALATDRGYTLVLLESVTDGQGTPTDQDRARAEARVRFRKERVAMDRLARQLLGTAQVSAMDPSLRWSWETRVKP
jgi:hypothetical protein